MRILLAGALSLLFCSCREITPFEPPVTLVPGYVLSGTVTTGNGIPIDSVDVIVWYNFVATGSPSGDTSTVFLVDTTMIVDIAVYDVRSEFVKQIFLGYRASGPLRRASWDGTDRNGNSVPSGMYFMRYSLDTTIVKNEIRIVHGRTTTVTNSQGKFTLGVDELPIHQVFNLYDPLGNFIGARRILPDIDLRLRRGSLTAIYSIALRKDTLNVGSYILQ